MRVLVDGDFGSRGCCLIWVLADEVLVDAGVN